MEFCTIPTWKENLFSTQEFKIWGVYTVFLIPRRFFENNGILYYSYMEENLFFTQEFKIWGYLKTSPEISSTSWYPDKHLFCLRICDKMRSCPARPLPIPISFLQAVSIAHRCRCRRSPHAYSPACLYCFPDTQEIF